MTPKDPIAFIKEHTVVLAPQLVQEIKLYQATEMTPIWYATEKWLEKNQLPPPFWAFPWAGGQALARYILDNPTLVQGKRVLDFAAGSGLCAIAAAKAGAHQVTAVEIDPLAVASIKLNAALNEVAVEVLYTDIVGENVNTHDIILAGDICYQQAMAFKCLRWLREQVSQGITVLLGDPERAYFPKAGLIVLASHDVAVDKDLESTEVRTVRVVSLLAD